MGKPVLSVGEYLPLMLYDFTLPPFKLREFQLEF